MNFHRLNWGCAGLAIVALIAGVGFGTRAEACTIAVVSGKATEDGRPLLWKNRDTKSRYNRVQVFDDGKYRVLAVVDAGNSASTWMGLNEAGLCLLNSVSRDLPGGNREGPGNGRFMKRALQNCGSVADLEKLLEETNDGGRRTKSNFACIDAQGAAVIFETGHRSFVKFDANDPQTAPRGYIVRTNFAMTAEGAKHLDNPEGFLKVYSGERYLRAEHLVEETLKKRGRFNYRIILQDFTRDLSETLEAPLCPLSACESLDEIALPGLSFPARINTESTINRKSTVSAAVFHGVKPGESPRWTTMWTLLGQPAFSIAVPCWLTGSKPSPPLTGSQNSPLCRASGELRQMNYVSPEHLSTRWLRAVWSRTLQAEHAIIRQTEKRLNRWRTKPAAPPLKEVARFQDQMVDAAMQSLLAVHNQIGSLPALAEKPAARQLITADADPRQAAVPD